MKILFCYLPLENHKGFLCISQNRFAKFRGDRELIYPLVPASGLTLLRNAGYEVEFIDSIYQSLSVESFLELLENSAPDLLIYETKTPVVKENWRVVNSVKERMPELKIATVGDHTSVLPLETLDNSMADYVLTGGDYDVSMLGLAEHLNNDEPLPRGIFYKCDSRIKNTGKYELIKNLDSLPFIDREIIPWEHYHESWRLYNRFMYMMGSRGCPCNCTFCSWPQMLYDRKVRYRSIPNILDEIELLKRNYKVQEIFFDDDTFTTNKKRVLSFCKGIKERDIDIVWSCNGRVDTVDSEMLTLMKKSGCRLIKFGIESSNQKTLDRIKKGYKVQQIKDAFRISKDVGILRHGTVMLGFPWESCEDIRATIEFVKQLEVDTVQFSIPIVYPGTYLFEEAVEKGWLKFPPGEWEKYDMSSPTLESQYLKSEEIIELCENAWKEIYFSPKFILKKFMTIKSPAHAGWLFRGAKSVLKGHITPLRK